MNPLEICTGLGELVDNPDLSPYYREVCAGALRLLTNGTTQKRRVQSKILMSPEDAAWSIDVKMGHNHCVRCGRAVFRDYLEAAHCVPRGHDTLRDGFDTHSRYLSCCLKHDRKNGAPLCAGPGGCHSVIDNDAEASEIFWRSYFAAQGFPRDHYDNLQAEKLRLNKRVPRPA